jgi:hypothetical protein
MRTKIPLISKNQTGDAMYELCSRFNSDLNIIYLQNSKDEVPLSSLDISQFYDFVRKIPYKEDTKPIEVIGRPVKIIQLKKIDCKKKAVLIGSYASYHNIPFRFVASSNRKDKKIHHVYPELYLSGKWVTFDATYSDYYIGQKKYTTAKEYL